ncbi:UV damage endonuclease UvdE [Kwoniella shandongensis]|uniref:UV damage endonuclease UvdE n=1 Tax=Kwoniella shandongensis TaxID=1734106 RepID=A0A5M6BPG8_9TREE|nr:UV damage endonuclease UvdE [Kwoniella shandongensis]KAA5524796.1 UV damage endonuclease UvdE [Kwoniella shandongensis]
MPPRKTRSTMAVVIPPKAADLHTAVKSEETIAPPHHTLIDAIEHIPLAPQPISTRNDDSESDEALTPISSSPSAIDKQEAEAAVDAATERVLSKRKRSTKKDVSYVENDHDEEAGGEDGGYEMSELSELSEPESVVKTPVKKKTTPKKKAASGGKKAAKVTPKKEQEDDDGDAEEGEEKPKKVKKPTPKKSRIAVDEPEFDEDGNEIVKKKRKVKVYPKKVYEIPDVERKTTTFKGRLGYACLNTVLRGTKPDSIFCSRTCRIASIEEEGMELPKGLALLNVRDLKTMIQWNEDNKIRFMRMSSEMFPFASHAKYGYDLSFADEGLKEAGALAKKYGHRLTMHPGQFTQIGSPKDGVVEASIRELNYQCEIMDRMEIGIDGVMIIHMGGIYGDKESTLARFKENYTTRLSENVKKRLVLENDEICYNVDDIFPLCDELNIPIIFDYHHDWIYPSAEPPSVLIPKIAEIWKRRGIPMKQHLSEPRPGAESVMERRAHADRCKALPADLPDDVDLMIEAKDKEQAVFELYRIYGLEDVIHDNLRPPDPNPGMHTKGRKSSLKKKTKETGEVDSEGEAINLSDIEKEGDGGVGDESVIKGKKVVGARNDAGMEVDGEEGLVHQEGKEKARVSAPKGRKRKSDVLTTNTQEGEKAEDVKVEGEVETPSKPKAKRGRKSAAAIVKEEAAVNAENGQEENKENLAVVEEAEAVEGKKPIKKKGRASKAKEV